MGVIVGDSARLGQAAGHDQGTGVEHCWCGLPDGHSDRLSARPAQYAGLSVGPPTVSAHGMTVRELAEQQRLFTNYARMRLTSAVEYDDGEVQAFERFGPDRLLLELRQEIADAVNYLTFLDIQLARWGKRIEGMA